MLLLFTYFQSKLAEFHLFDVCDQHLTRLHSAESATKKRGPAAYRPQHFIIFLDHPTLSRIQTINYKECRSFYCSNSYKS